MTTTTTQPRLVQLLFPDRELSHWVEGFLGNTFHEAMAEITEELAETAKEVRTLPLSQYKEPDQLRINWLIASHPPPRTDWKYLSYTDPAKAGILCGRDGQPPLLLLPETLKLSKDLRIGELDWLLDAWRETIRLIWAAKIITNLIPLVRTGQLALPGPIPGTDAAADDSQHTIGWDVSLPLITDDELIKLRKLEDEAAFGSGACESAAAGALREWCRDQTIGSLMEQGFAVDEVHWLLYTIGRNWAELDFELVWIHDISSYELCIGIKNRDQHGFHDPNRSFFLPMKRLDRFYEEIGPEIRSHLVRLAIRQSWKKAWDLGYPALVLDDLD